MKEKKYTYPRVHFERVLRDDMGETPFIQMIFSSLVIDRHGNEGVEQLIAFYTYYGKRDSETEMEAANEFHNMCREAYYSDTVHDEPIDEDNIKFNEEDERW